MKKPTKILFVCLGNICRSPAAHAIMEALVESKGKADEYIIDSAGTYGGHAGELPDKRMRIHAAQRGYQLTHRSRRVTGNDLEDFDLIIAMDHNNMRTLQQMASSVEEERKIVPISKFFSFHPHYDHVPDPYYEGAQGFELVMDLLEDAAQSIFNETQSKH